MFDDLLTLRKPPPNRIGSCEGGIEHHLSEGAVMVAFAMHLLRNVKELQQATIHPDGEHGKRFDFRTWMETHNFAMTTSMGSTTYGGIYIARTGQSIIVNPSSG